MTEQPPGRAAWPPAFSDTFVEEAQSMLRISRHLVVVGPLGSSRGLLASLVTGAPEGATVWWRSDGSTVRPRAPFAAVNHVIPALRAQPGQSVDEVVAAASARLTDVPVCDGLPQLILREADLSDSESIEVLVRLVADERIRLVTTAGPEFAQHPLIAGHAAVVELTPLDDSVIGYLLEHRFAVQVHPTTIAMLRDRSQGAYGVLREVAENDFAAHRIAVVAGVLVPTSADGRDPDSADPVSDEWGVSRYRDEVGPERDLLDIVALLYEVVETEALDAFGPDAVSHAIEIGAVHRRGDRLNFSSHAEATLMQRRMPVERRTTLYSRYGDQLRGTFALPSLSAHLATWTLSIGRTLSADLAVRASTVSNQQGRYAQALRFIGSIPAQERPTHLLVEEAHALNESGAVEPLVALLTSIDLTTVPDHDLLPLLCWSAQHLDDDEHRRRLARLRSDAAGDTARLGALEVFELFNDAHCGASESLGRQLASVAMADRIGPVTYAMALVARAAWARHSSRPAEAVRLATEAVAQLESHGAELCSWHLDAARETLIRSYITSFDFDAAQRSLAEYSAPGAVHGNFGRLGMPLWGQLGFFRGDIRTALANFGIALAALPSSDPHEIRAWLEAMHAQAVAQTGDIERVEHLLQNSASRPVGFWRQHELERRISEACAYDSIGDPEAALELLESVIGTAREHDLHLAEVDAAVLCVQIGGPQFNSLLLRATKDLADASGTSLIWKRFAEAIRDNQMSSLVELAEELDHAGAYVFAAEVAQFTLDIARRASDMTLEQRDRMQVIADPMAHRHVSRDR